MVCCPPHRESWLNSQMPYPAQGTAEPRAACVCVGDRLRFHTGTGTLPGRDQVLQLAASFGNGGA